VCISRVLDHLSLSIYILWSPPSQGHFFAVAYFRLPVTTPIVLKDCASSSKGSVSDQGALLYSTEYTKNLYINNYVLSKQRHSIDTFDVGDTDGLDYCLEVKLSDRPNGAACLKKILTRFMSKKKNLAAMTFADFQTLSVAVNVLNRFIQDVVKF
jgi:hypothetical protein